MSAADPQLLKELFASNQFDVVSGSALESEGVFFLGLQGSGKSTTISIELGADTKYNNDTEKIEIVTDTGGARPAVSDAYESKTTQISMWRKGDRVYVDTAGVNEDRDSTHKKYTTFCLCSALSMFKRFKIAIVLDWRSLKASRLTLFKQVIKELCNIFSGGGSSVATIEALIPGIVPIYTFAVGMNGQIISKERVKQLFTEIRQDADKKLEKAKKEREEKRKMLPTTDDHRTLLTKLPPLLLRDSKEREKKEEPKSDASELFQSVCEEIEKIEVMRLLAAAFEKTDTCVISFPTDPESCKIQRQCFQKALLGTRPVQMEDLNMNDAKPFMEMDEALGIMLSAKSPQLDNWSIQVHLDRRANAVNEILNSLENQESSSRERLRLLSCKDCPDDVWKGIREKLVKECDDGYKNASDEIAKLEEESTRISESTALMEFDVQRGFLAQSWWFGFGSYARGSFSKKYDKRVQKVVVEDIKGGGTVWHEFQENNTKVRFGGCSDYDKDLELRATMSCYEKDHSQTEIRRRTIPQEIADETEKKTLASVHKQRYQGACREDLLRELGQSMKRNEDALKKMNQELKNPSNPKPGGHGPTELQVQYGLVRMFEAMNERGVFKRIGQQHCKPAKEYLKKWRKHEESVEKLRRVIPDLDVETPEQEKYEDFKETHDAKLVNATDAGTETMRLVLTPAEWESHKTKCLPYILDKINSLEDQCEELKKTKAMLEETEKVLTSKTEDHNAATEKIGSLEADFEQLKSKLETKEKEWQADVEKIQEQRHAKEKQNEKILKEAQQWQEIEQRLRKRISELEETKNGLEERLAIKGLNLRMFKRQKVLKESADARLEVAAKNLAKLILACVGDLACLPGLLDEMALEESLEAGLSSCRAKDNFCLNQVIPSHGIGVLLDVKKQSRSGYAYMCGLLKCGVKTLSAEVDIIVAKVDASDSVALEGLRALLQIKNQKEMKEVFQDWGAEDGMTDIFKAMSRDEPPIPGLLPEPDPEGLE